MMLSPIRPQLKSLSVCLATLLLAACGEMPTAKLTSGGNDTARSIISLPDTGASADLAQHQWGASIADNGEGGQLLQRTRQLIAAAPGFEAEVVSRALGSYADGKTLEKPREVRTRYKLAWQPASRFAADILESSDGSLKGVRMVTNDGLSFKVRAGGLLGLVSRTMSADDDRLKNARGHTIGQIQPNGQLSRLLAPTAFWTIVGRGRTPNGEATARVAVGGIPRLDPEIDHEELELVEQTLSLYQLVGFAGNRRLISYDFLNFRWTTPLQEAFVI